VFHGNAYVERHAPCLPLSRDSIQLENLRRSLAVYRMVFGQPRQDDLMAFLLARVDRETLDRHSDLLRVSLAPPISEPLRIIRNQSDQELPVSEGRQS
jgi:hypothetical protein